MKTVFSNRLASLGCGPACLFLTATLGVMPAGGGDAEPAAAKRPATMGLTSPAFSASQPIPARHTCDGPDVSPSLKWTGAPADTKSFALICDDPDAPVGAWVHWVIFNLPASTTELPEKFEASETLPDGTRQGLNDFGRVGYGGPCPPPGKAHRYFFKLYALDVELSLRPRATKAQLLRAMQGHVIGEGALIGTYQRRR